MGIIGRTQGVKVSNRPKRKNAPMTNQNPFSFNALAIWSVSESACCALMVRLSAACVGTFWSALPDQLSTGQRERFLLALLLAGRPDLLLVDEFAAHLDGPNARQLARALARLAREVGITLVVSSHRVEVRAALEPDRIVYVGYGSVWSEPGH